MYERKYIVRGRQAYLNYVMSVSYTHLDVYKRQNSPSYYVVSVCFLKTVSTVSLLAFLIIFQYILVQIIKCSNTQKMGFNCKMLIQIQSHLIFSGPYLFCNGLYSPVRLRARDVMPYVDVHYITQMLLLEQQKVNITKCL